MPKPTEELALAEESLQQAKVVGVRENSSRYLAMAKQKHHEALVMLKNRKNGVAKRLLEQAAVDAQLAVAEIQAEQHLEERERLRQMIDELEEQLSEAGE